MTLGANIRALRKERNWSAEYLASLANCTQSTISELEHNNRSPQLSTLEKIASAFDVTIVDLLPIESTLPKGTNLREDEKRTLLLLSKVDEDDRKYLLQLLDSFDSLKDEEQRLFFLMLRITDDQRMHLLNLLESLVEK